MRDAGTRREFVLAVAALLLLTAGCRIGPGQRDGTAKRVFYPLPPDPPRLQFLTAINGAPDVAGERAGLERLILGEREEAKATQYLTRPYGVAVWQGKVYVCDYDGADVKVFDFANKRFYRLGVQPPIMAKPSSICIDSDGYKFVIESRRRLIHAFGPDDAFLTTFRVKDYRPAGVVATGGELFISDIANDHVRVHDRSTGEPLRVLCKKGHGPGELLMPNAIALDAEGHLYVSDQMNFRFQKLDRQGKPLMVKGGAGDTFGTFARPHGIAVGPDGTIFVVERLYELVQMFNQKGQVLMAFGNYHGAPGFLELPAGIAVDTSCLPYFSKYVDPRFQAEYLVFVVSQVGRTKVGVYAYGQPKPGMTISRPLIPKAQTTQPEVPTTLPKEAPKGT